MSPNRRIFLNVVATYGRSLYTLGLGLFTARWALQALGQTDFGLFGLLGGLIAFVTFLNGILAHSVGRFYAVSIGASRKGGNEENGLLECKKWFNTALSIHTILPLVLIMIGYPLGVYVIKNFLVIPNDRIGECLLVWCFTCVSCLISMFNVPFSAMYTAKQEIAELTLFSLFTTTANALFLYYMVSHPGVWLAKYALGTCIIGAIPQFAIAIRAICQYQECKIRLNYWYDMKKYRELITFAFARFWSDFASLISIQGQGILVNKFMGPVYNASMSVGNSVATHAASLSSSLSGAFSPAIANLCGEGRFDAMKRFCFMTSRLGAVLILVFAVPLLLEINEVLCLWLKTPPPFTVEICFVVLIRMVLDRMTDGYWMAIYSKGEQIMKYTWAISWASISTVIVSFVCFLFGIGMWSIIIGLASAKLLCVIIRLYYGRKILNYSTKYWSVSIFCPIMLSALVATMFGLLVRLSFQPSVFRLLLTTATCELILLPMSWYVIFQRDERSYVVEKIKFFVSKIYT